MINSVVILFQQTERCWRPSHFLSDCKICNYPLNFLNLIIFLFDDELESLFIVLLFLSFKKINLKIIIYYS